MMRQLISTARSRGRTLVRRLRAFARPSAVLLLALCFAFAEPLVCIIQCELYIPWLERHQQAHQHHQHSQAPTGASETTGAGALADKAFAAQPTALPANPNCFQASGSTSPTPALPSPVHDVILAALLVLPGIVIQFRMPTSAESPPHSYGAAPPTPPPRYTFA